MRTLTFPLRGAGGEPVDLWRTFTSHGVAALPPMSVDESAHTFEITLPTGRDQARTVLVEAHGKNRAKMTILGRAPAAAVERRLLEQVRHVLRMDEDLSGFYAKVKADPDLSWASLGAGRMIQSPSAFEDVVKTICTTNCAWSATVRMVSALVEHLGPRAPGAPAKGARGRAFPSPETMANVNESFYKDVVRAGYRGRYLKDLATSVANGTVDLEQLARSSKDEISDDEMEVRLLALPGVGSYAAAHTMMMFGRYSRLILDSWTRPKYAQLRKRKAVTDATITRRFKRYGDHAGLAFWLYLTRDWVEETG